MIRFNVLNFAHYKFFYKIFLSICIQKNFRIEMEFYQIIALYVSEQLFENINRFGIKSCYIVVIVLTTNFLILVPQIVPVKCYTERAVDKCPKIW